MAITQCVPTSFKVDILNAVHNFTSHTFKLALYQSTASLDATTTAYTATGEASGTNYSAGGSALVTVAPTSSGTVAFIDFNDLVFSTVTITARGGLIYNSSASNKAVSVIDFGSDKVATAQSMTITFPAASSADAILRIGG